MATSDSRDSRPVKLRIAPSPTGDPHVGTAYIALFNLAFAKQRGGKFIIRIEDTDRARSTRESEAAIFEALRWLGITWDEGPDVGGPHAPYRQSERLDIYKQHAEQLLASGHAYWCTCTPERLEAVRKEQEKNKASVRGYDGQCRDAGHKSGLVVRLKVPRGPGAQTTFVDAFRTDLQVWDNTQIDDQVLMKSDGFPTYHLANVVDDHLMEITHVMRGEEWLSSTPKHVILYESFGWQPPVFAHLPLLRNADKSKVSKRKNPVSLSWFREAGYFPEAMVNFLGTMAFTFADGRETFTLQDFIEHFDMERVVLGGPIFDLSKLSSIQERMLRARSDRDIVQYLKSQLFSDAYLEKVVSVAKERFGRSEEFVDLTSYFFTGSVNVDPKELVLKGKTPKESAELYAELTENIDVLFDWRADTISALLTKFSEERGMGAKDLYAPLRWMTTGKKGSPPIPDVLAILGRERVRTRIRAQLEPLKKLPKPQP